MGAKIRTTVHLSSVTSHNDGRVIATKVNTAALNRLAFHHSIAIENAQYTSDQFSPLNPGPGVLAVAVSENLFANDAVSAVVSITAAQLKTQLEQPAFPGRAQLRAFPVSPAINEPRRGIHPPLPYPA